MFLHVVQSALSDALLKDEIFKLMAVTVILDPCCDFTETVEENFIVCNVLFVIPVNENGQSSARVLSFTGPFQFV